MNTTAQNSSNTSLLKNKKGLIVLFVLLSSVGMFGQNKASEVQATSTAIEVPNVTVNHVEIDSDVEFMNWFMSSKQTQSFENGSEVSSSSTPFSRKKQIISSGVVPNKVLYRTLIKKVISQEIAIV